MSFFVSQRYLSFCPPDWKLSDLLSAFLHIITKKNSTEDLENTIKKVLGISHVMVTNLGRTALIIGLKSIGLEKGAGIVLPTIVCPTVIRAVLKAGCHPILVDVEQNLHVSIRTLNSCQNKNAKAIIVPHLYGLSAPIEEIKKWAKKEKLYLIDDAAQAVGISVNGKYLGTFGDFGILSFGPLKSISTPRGGALISEDNKIVVRAKKSILTHESFYWSIRRVLGFLIKFHLRPYYLRMKEKNHFKMSKADNLSNNVKQVQMIDETSLLSNLEARLVESVLQKTTAIIDRRRKSAYEVWNLIKKFNKFEFVGYNTVPYIKIPIRLPEGLKAEEAVRCFRNMKIEAEKIYKPLHLYKEYKMFAAQPLTTAEDNWVKTFLIPNPVNEYLYGIEKFDKAFNALSN